MAKFICQNGTLIFNNIDFNDMCLQNVNMDIKCDVYEFKCMGSDGWVDNIEGTRSATFSFDTALDDTAGIQLDDTVGEEGSLFFDTVDGRSYSATVIITSASVTTSPEDVAKVSWEATADGIFRES